MFGAHRRAVKGEEASALEDAIDDGQGQVIVMEHAAPGGDGLVGGEDHRAPPLVAVVDYVEEHVGGIRAIGEVADLVDHEETRMRIGCERFGEAALPEGGGEVIDEFRGGDEVGVESILDGAIGDRDGEMGLTATGFAVEDERTALGDEVRGEGRA